MDSYTPAIPPHVTGSSRLRSLAPPLAIIAISGEAWRRNRARKQRDAFPVVYAQNTNQNQAICSLMSAVLLRTIRRNPHRRISQFETQQRQELLVNMHNGMQISLHWHEANGTVQTSGPTYATSISVPTVLLFQRTLPGEASLTKNLSRAIASHGWIAAELDQYVWDESFTTMR